MIKKQAQPNNNSKTSNNNNHYLHTESAALLGQGLALIKPGLQSVDGAMHLGATILYLGTSDLGDFAVSKEEQGLLNED